MFAMTAATLYELRFKGHPCRQSRDASLIKVFLIKPMKDLSTEELPHT